MSYITGAIYPSSDRPQRRCTPKKKPSNAYADEPHRRSPSDTPTPTSTNYTPCKNLPTCTNSPSKTPDEGHQRQTRTIRRLPLHRHPPRHLPRQRRRSAPQRTAPLHRPRYTLALVRDVTAHQRQVQPALRHPRCIPPPDCCTASSAAPSTGTPRARWTRKRQRRN